MTEQLGDEKTTVRTASTADAADSAGPRNIAGPRNADGLRDSAGSRSADGPRSAASAAKAGTVDARSADAGSADIAAPTAALTAAPAAPTFETRHAVLRYTTLRLALFLAALLLVWGVAVVFNMDLSSQLSKLTLLAVALLLSSAVSFIVLSKYRDAMSAGIVARTQKLSRKFDDAASFEDEDEDE